MGGRNGLSDSPGNVIRRYAFGQQEGRASAPGTEQGLAQAVGGVDGRARTLFQMC